MALTKVVIGYSKNQRVRRTTVVPDDDSQVALYVSWILSMGEGVLVGSLADYQAIGPDAMLARQFSLPPVNPRCALVDGSGIVIAILGADPTMDQHWQGRYVHDPNGVAVIGQSLFGTGLL